MDEPGAPQRKSSWLGWLIAVLAIAGIVLVIAGRLLDAGKFPGWQDALYSVLLAFAVDGTFLNPQNPLTPLGALFAALALYLAVFAGVLALLNKRIVAFRVSRMRNHIVVIGAGPAGEKLARALAGEARVALMRPGEPDNVSGIAVIPRPGAMRELIAAANLGAARAVVVAGEDEKDNAALALGLAAARESGRPAIWAQIGDRVIADRLANAVMGAGRIEVFSDAPLIARALFSRHPAHALAERMAADRVHLLVAGFGRVGQAIAEEAISSGIVDGLATPMVTVLVRDASRAEAAFRASRPALDLAADIAFIEADLVELAVAPGLARAALEALARRDDAARVTQIALCLGSDADNVRLALVLPELRRREGRYFAPAFMRARDAGVLGLVVPPAENIVDPNSGVTPIADPAGLIAGDVVDRALRDQAARALHAAYLRQQGVSPGAADAWNGLAETYRRANRRGADHLAAKLWSLGLTSETEPQEPIELEASVHRRMIAPLIANPRLPAAEMLAGLERRRWIAERVMDGWVAGAPRDDDRKVHPLLAGGADAAPAEADRDKDREQIRVLLQSVGIAGPGSGALREMRVAIAGHRGLGAEIEASAAKAAADALAGRFGQGDAVTLVSPLAPGADIAATEAIAAALTGKAGQLRLIVPEAVPYRIVLEVAAAETGGGEAFAAAMMLRRAQLFARFARVDIVRVGMPGVSDDSYRRDTARFELGLRRVNAYLARRCDLAVLLWDGKEAKGPGGTGELAAWLREPGAIDPVADFAQRGKPEEDRLIIVPVQR
jgi:voltage-gated potassium channel Kch